MLASAWRTRFQLVRSHVARACVAILAAAIVLGSCRSVASVHLSRCLEPAIELEPAMLGPADPPAAAAIPRFAQSGGDEIRLEGGDVIYGKVKRLASRELTVSVDYSNPNLVLKWSHVTSLAVRSQMRVELDNYRAYKGTITMTKDGVFSIEIEPGKPPIVVSRDEVLRFDRRTSEWEGKITVSSRITTDQTTTYTALADGNLLWKGPTTELLFRIQGDYVETADTTTTQRAYAQIRYDYLIDAGAFVFSTAELTTNRVQNVKARASLTVGAGYNFVDTSSLLVRADLGVGATESRLETEPNRSYASGRLGSEFLWRLPLEFDLRNVFTYYASFEFGGDWQIRNELSLDKPIVTGWSVTAFWITSIEHQPAVGADRESDTFFIGVTYKF